MGVTGHDVSLTGPPGGVSGLAVELFPRIWKFDGIIMHTLNDTTSHADVLEVTPRTGAPELSLMSWPPPNWSMMLVMSKPDPIETARALVAERFPSARQAWLAGSVTRGEATETSDLDIPVLVDAADPHRETLTYRGWLVEVFVHTEESIRRFLARDVARRRPTLARMISTGVPLLSPNAGIEIRRECADLLARGPAPVTDLELAHARYALTDQLDDLVGGAVPPVLDAIIIDVWRGCLELILARAGRWSGTGKWLVREVQALDHDEGSDYVDRLHAALHAALSGHPRALTKIADEILLQAGGRLTDGFELAAPSVP